MIPIDRRSKGGHWSGLLFVPECAHDPPEAAVCTLFDRCKDCPYPGHGFICWKNEDSCLRTTMNKINGMEAREDDISSGSE